MNKQKGIELTNEEFFFLASLCNCDALIGVPDPFVGFWIEEIEEEMKRSAQSLVKKGYIVYNDHDIDVKSELFEYIQICTKTKMTLWVQLDESGEREDTYFYFGARKVVESRVSENGEHLSYHLREVGTPIQTWNDIVKKMLPNEKQISYDGRIMLGAEEFADMLDNKEYSINDIELKLKEQLPPCQMIIFLAQAIKNHERYGQLTAFYRGREQWSINSIGLLSDKSTNWIAIGTDERLQRCVEIQCMPSKTECFQEIQNLIVRAKEFSKLYNKA